MDPITILLAVAVLGSSAATLFLLRRSGASGGETVAAKIIENAEREADLLRKAAAMEIDGLRKSAEADVDAEIRGRAAALQGREQAIAAREADVEDRSRRLSAAEAETESVRARLTADLERVSSLSADEARQMLLEQLETSLRFDSERLVSRMEEEARAEADDRARHVIASAIQRIASDYVTEATISVINLPSDDMKGRIIGREGRNIRALESATGVNLIVDDTPESILVSSFDPYRREVARRTLENLMADGRFQPTRIEETVSSVEKKLEEEVLEEASKILYELDIHDMHPELIGTLGRLKYRLSYGQNNLAHAREVALICGMMADELKLDRKLAVRGGLLHDVGKVLSHDQEGGHAVLGAELAEKCGEHPNVVNAIGAHHGDMKPITREAWLVAAGDALSAGRPGARRENMDLYVKRLKNLEAVAGEFPGVDRAFALQAGRELRVLVDADRLDDAECLNVSRDIAKRIEKEIAYPGQIKVCLVRESRFIEYAR
ncbi:MAG: ribonuclease Y [Nitrospirota bacterium]|nr:ribonuclease Y [Nitrospirota bacterium]